ncbi:hypothetical protein Trco_002131 [Trichoderma cornu-damae]|uniref:Uncharacterized protein n=1 Tax=Trichoderma cornu-damae TaxID=654480 RepID=A0A9P8QNS5_9HYPO|nr:hypothetical protein Trco_002131 [Trichoderma cornu-damae]
MTSSALQSLVYGATGTARVDRGFFYSARAASYSGATALEELPLALYAAASERREHEDPNPLANGDVPRTLDSSLLLLYSTVGTRLYPCFPRPGLAYPEIQ